MIWRPATDVDRARIATMMYASYAHAPNLTFSENELVLATA